MTLDQVIAGITPADTAAMERAKARWDSIAKPLGSLGALEEAVIRIAGMTGSADVDISKRAVVVMCADNGVVAQGVTQTGQEVTAIVAENMSTGDTSVCAMARSAGAEVVPVDIGTAVPLTGARIVQRCVRRGTADMTRGPAMSREEAVQAVLTGVETARELCAGGVHLLATGEMGIGNTTTSRRRAGRAPQGGRPGYRRAGRGVPRGRPVPYAGAGGRVHLLRGRPGGRPAVPGL